MRKVQVVLQDDIDGTEPARTVRFALDGEEFEIDLNDEHAAALRDCLAPWTEAGRRAATPQVPQPRSMHSRVQSRHIRRWAEAEGIPVASRGRLPVDLRARYEAAH